ncbi:MAG: hypothetical protein HYR71_01850 [Chloroflexi bacterium]|nr:hypothetical protein [Chloroflexota bacterium]
MVYLAGGYYPFLKALPVSLHLALVQAGLEANALITLGPAFVITRFVLGKIQPGLGWLSARLLVRAGHGAY